MVKLVCKFKRIENVRRLLINASVSYFVKKSKRRYFRNKNWLILKINPKFNLSWTEIR